MKWPTCSLTLKWLKTWAFWRWKWTLADLSTKMNFGIQQLTKINGWPTQIHLELEYFTMWSSQHCTFCKLFITHFSCIFSNLANDVKLGKFSKICKTVWPHCQSDMVICNLHVCETSCIWILQRFFVNSFASF